jgi:hypothetical protein
MRTILLVSVSLLSACGGSWSNRDLEFAAALPSRAELSSKLPASASSGQPLTRSDGLNAGEPSQAYADTQKAAKDFNGLLDFFLGLLDTVRTVPPTSRSGESRTWGPFNAKDVPGSQFQVIIALVSTTPNDTYGWKVQTRKLGTAEWTDLVRGTFQASAETVRKGQGQIEIPVKEIRAQIPVTDPNLASLDSIVIGYVTNADPTLSSMVFTFTPGNPEQLSAAGYQARQSSNGSGAMGFSVKTTNPLTLRFDVVSKWRTDGAGISVATVSEGTYRGATRVECWDTAFKVTFYKENWPGGQESGRFEDCASVEGL